jgi:hypothetical protein
MEDIIDLFKMKCTKPDHVHSDVEQRSILKHSEDVVSSKSVEQKGILKEEIKSKDNSIKAILKHDEKNVSDSDKTSSRCFKIGLTSSLLAFLSVLSVLRRIALTDPSLSWR